MKILNINNKIDVNSNLNFLGLHRKPKTLFNISNTHTDAALCKKNAIKDIINVRPFMLGGTQCNNSIPLRNFWHFFESDKRYFKGFSTNKDGFADSFLKSKSNVPLSTSFVHDCSVMYLFNQNTKTHALYHAHPECTKEQLKFMLETLMPEGFTKGAIIPGDKLFCRYHTQNMKNMLQLMRAKNPQALINVYNASSRYPEMVGYNGFMYEIPNKKVRSQISEGIYDPWDFGQSSFKIMNLQGFNTFDRIDLCKNTSELLALQKSFKSENYSEEIAEILNKQVEKRLEILKEIEGADNFKTFEKVCNKYHDKKFIPILRYQKENLFLNLLTEIHDIDDLRFFYNMVKPDLARMDRLADELQNKKREILK